MAGNRDLDVPMAWLWAEQGAEDLIAQADGAVSPATFEFRATRDVLASTILFAGLASEAGDLSVGQLVILRDRLSAWPRWLAWCQAHFSAGGMASADLGLAHNAWGWLTRGRLVFTLQQAGLAYAKAMTAMPGAAGQVGVTQARRVVGAHLARWRGNLPEVTV